MILYLNKKWRVIMEIQRMAHAQISIPADSLELITALVVKLGG